MESNKKLFEIKCHCGKVCSILTVEAGTEMTQADVDRVYSALCDEHRHASNE